MTKSSTISFLLNAPSANKPTPIFTFLSFAGKRTKVYAGRSIHPQQWDAKERRALVRGYPRNGALNDWLEILAERLETCYDTHAAAGTMPTTTELRALSEFRDLGTEKIIPAPGNQFWPRFEEWLSYKRSTGAASTVQMCARSGQHLREFAEATKYAVDFDTLTPVVIDRWATYLLRKQHHIDSTINKVLGHVGTFMKWAAKRGYTTNTLSGITRPTREPDIVTLTAEELNALEALPLAVGSRLEKVRAWFLLSCYTGLRYSDFVKIQPQHVREASATLPAHLRITVKKKRAVVSVPMSAAALAIVQRLLAGELSSSKGKPISNPVLNRYLKELGQAAGIDTPIEVIRYKGGEAEVRTCPKYEMLTAHTGRRTFVTLNLAKGMSAQFVMKITGHTSYKSFQRYINLSSQQVAQEFARFHEMPVYF